MVGTLTNNKDTVVWELDKSKSYTTKSVYGKIGRYYDRIHGIISMPTLLFQQDTENTSFSIEEQKYKASIYHSFHDKQDTFLTHLCETNFTKTYCQQFLIVKKRM